MGLRQGYLPVQWGERLTFMMPFHVGDMKNPAHQGGKITEGLVLAPVPIVQGVAMTVVDVVHVVAMGDSNVATAGAVLMIVVGVGAALGGFALVPVAVVLPVEVTVVNVVDVVTVRDGHVAAVRAVNVGVVFVSFTSHDVLLYALLNT